MAGVKAAAHSKTVPARELKSAMLVSSQPSHKYSGFSPSKQNSVKIKCLLKPDDK